MVTSQTDTPYGFGEERVLRVGPPGRLGLLLTGIALVVAIGLLAPAGALAAPGGGKLTISPQPGTPDASPQTQISILGVSRSRIRSVSVTGQSSGPHSGSLHSYSSHRGASLVLGQPLA